MTGLTKAQAAEFERLQVLAREFGLTPEETRWIFDAVDEKAVVYGTYGDGGSRLADARRRIHLARK